MVEIDNDTPITLISKRLKHLHFLNINKQMLLNPKYDSIKKYTEEDIEYHTKGLNDINEQISKLKNK